MQVFLRKNCYRRKKICIIKKKSVSLHPNWFIMENYIVSARKYRPSTFESVVGQKALTETLRNAIRQNHLAHAYLFCGPRGVGKTTCARIFAKTINCMHPANGFDACNECESCRAFNEQRSFNIHELDAASNNSVEDIRSLIAEVRIPPQVGKYSVYIIDEVHMLSSGAFNALLKTLEEPPSYAIFILATTEKHKVLPTILSRCQVYDFSRITVADTIAHLQYVAAQEGINASEQALNVVAQKADGGMRDALSIFDQLVSFCGNEISYERAIEVLNVLDSHYYFQLVDKALAGDVSGALLLLNDVLQKGFDAGNFVTGFAQHLRDVLVSKDSQTVKLLETSDAIRQEYAAQAQRCPAPWIFQALDIMNTCDINYRTAKNKRLTVELALIRLTQLLNAAAQPASKPAPAIQSSPVQAPKPAPKPAPQPAPAPTSIPQIPDIPVIPQIPQIPTIPTAGSAAVAPVNAPATPPPPAPPVQQQNSPFTVDQFEGAWAGLNSIFKEEPRLQAMLSSRTPKQIGDTHYVLMLANPWQKKEYLNVESKVLSHLRTILKNDFISIEVQIEEVTHERQAYTAEEKYKLLSELNPELKRLKETMNLMLD